MEFDEDEQARMARMRVSPGRVAVILGSMGALLVLANGTLLLARYGGGHDYVFGLAPLLRLDREMNLPSFFSGCLLLFDAALFALVWRARRSASGPRAAWLLLAGVFVFLAYDELFMVHERLGSPLRRAMGLSGPFYYSWFVAYAAGIVLLAVLFVPLSRRLDGKVRRWLGWAVAVYLAGAVGFEMLEGAYYQRTGSESSLAYALMTTAEESLEIGGLIMLVFGLLSLLQSGDDGFAIVIAPNQRR